MYFILLVVVVVLTLGIIMLLHRFQLKNRKDIVDRTAPLAAVDLSFSAAPQRAADEPVLPASFIPQHGKPDLPDNKAANHTELPESSPAPGILAANPAADTDSDTWLEQVKRLRDENKLEAALRLCSDNYPRIQAYQQSGIILRQQIRELIEQHLPVTAELKHLYRIAVLADLYRNSNQSKPKNAERTLAALQHVVFDYQNIGTRQLRLLTKSDIRHLEQLWGRPSSHLHAEDALGAQWQTLCL